MDPLLDENEPSSNKFKKGTRVPADAVGLAWVKSPDLTPSNNIVVIDTANQTKENNDDFILNKKVMFANELGILEDEFGNQIIDDEYPIVGDIFSIDEDYSLNPWSEYGPNHILPYVHVSRYFHIDKVGLAIGENLEELDSSVIRVVNSLGQDYRDGNNVRKYRIKIASAINFNVENGNTTAYRLHVYIDSNTNEDLYLQYNKCELNSENRLINQDINYQEILNPIPYFKYVPEETDVADPANINNPIYTTKPITKKSTLIGNESNDIDGYRVFVPKKAVPDPRTFQTFRWRIRAEFAEKYTLDPAEQSGIVNAAVLVTDAQPHSSAPFVFYNLERSKYNANGIKFVNPASDNPTYPKKHRGYWELNMDNLLRGDFDDQLVKIENKMKNLDVLFLCLPAVKFNLQKYMPILNYFANTLGKTVIIDSDGKTQFTNLGINMTGACNSVTGMNYTPGIPESQEGWASLRVVSSGGSDQTFSEGWESAKDEIFNAVGTLGGWSFFDNDGFNEFGSLCQYNKGLAHARRDPDTGAIVLGGYKVQRFSWTAGTGFKSLIRGKTENGNDYRSVLIVKKFPTGGAIYASSCGNYSTVSRLVHPGSSNTTSGGRIWSMNDGSEALSPEYIFNKTNRRYDEFINSFYIEGSYKLLYNTCLIALKNNWRYETRDEHAKEQTRYNPVYTHVTEWKPSWVIDAQKAGLSQKEIEENKFTKEKISSSNGAFVWKRILSDDSASNIIRKELEKKKLYDKYSKTVKTYYLEILGTNVIGGSLHDGPDNDVDGKIYELDSEYIPCAWTTADTSPFFTSTNIGPHIVKTDNIIGEYEHGRYSVKSYPSKPIKLSVKATYSDTTQYAVSRVLEYAVTGKATVCKKVDKGKGNADKLLTWNEEGSQSFYNSSRYYEEQLNVPSGISTYQDENHLTQPSLHWPSFGMPYRLGKTPGALIQTRGENVSFLQHVLDNCVKSGLFSYSGTIPQDGVFDARTEAAVKAFQLANDQVFEKDGIVDSETWCVLGNKILRGITNPRFLTNISKARQGLKDLYIKPQLSMRKQNISNENPNEAFLKMSPVSGGPNHMVEYIRLQFTRSYKIHGITIVPHLPFGTDWMILDAIDVVTGKKLLGYDQTKAKMRGMNKKIYRGKQVFIPIPDCTGDTVIIKLKQTNAINTTKYGQAKELGVQDIYVHAETTVGGGNVQVIPDYPITASGTITVRTPTTSMFRAMPPKLGDNAWYQQGSVEWQSVVLSGDGNDLFSYTLDPSTGGVKIYSGAATTINNDYTIDRTTVHGASFPNSSPLKSVYTMNLDGVVSKSPNTGNLSKKDGIVLFCKKVGNKVVPAGFPDMSVIIGAHEAQRHFSTIEIVREGTDQNIEVGFYYWTNTKKEYLGSREISYLEYMTRGPENIYVGAFCSAEASSTKVLPEINSNDTPLIPYRWIMPVYGIISEGGSPIRVEQPRHAYGATDMWALPIKTGKFNRVIDIPDIKQNNYTGYLKTYRGRTVKAFYDVAEAEKFPWSLIHGRPNVDIISETPIIESNSVIRVINYPILMEQFPTVNNTNADPVKPIFSIYTRPTINSEWEQIRWEDIEDYNVSNGLIYLKNKLSSTDPNLIKIDYTTSNSRYMYKGTASSKLCLNPYLPAGKEIINKPIFIYLKPRVVKYLETDVGNEQSEWVTIQDSISDRTLIWSDEQIDYSNPLSADYDPLIVELAIVYVTNIVNIDDIYSIDMRKRGGGFKDVSLDMLQDYNQEVDSYWDIGTHYGEPYQNSGFVIIRLPRSLQERIPDSQFIKDAIERNLPVGVGYKIEDLSGIDWD